MLATTRYRYELLESSWTTDGPVIPEQESNSWKTKRHGGRGTRRRRRAKEKEKEKRKKEKKKKNSDRENALCAGARRLLGHAADGHCFRVIHISPAVLLCFLQKLSVYRTFALSTKTGHPSHCVIQSTSFRLFVEEEDDAGACAPSFSAEADNSTHGFQYSP